MRQRCDLCGEMRDYQGGVTISRCCCDYDWICKHCVQTASLAHYIARLVEGTVKLSDIRV